MLEFKIITRSGDVIHIEGDDYEWDVEDGCFQVYRPAEGADRFSEVHCFPIQNVSQFSKVEK